MAKLLLVFIHGFRGSETSFKEFPDRLKTVLSSSYPNVAIDSVVYPRYKTSGNLGLAVENFCTWLATEVDHRLGGSGMIVLLSHSMGGIVATEAILLFQQKRAERLLKDAEIIGLLAYDTPFYSVNHTYVSTQAARGVQQVNDYAGTFFGSSAAAATTVPATRRLTASTTKPPATASSSRWSLLGKVAAVAAVGAITYMARDTISSVATNAYDELEFVSVLMNRQGCQERVQRLLGVPDILFRCFYVQLADRDRTFIALPPDETAHLFIPVPSHVESEVTAHTSMFDPAKNDHYYTLGADTISLISEMIARCERRR